MKTLRYLLYVAACVFFGFCFACVAPQTQGETADSVKTCIQGKVRMKNPIDSKQVPYAGVSVNAWHHEKDLALAEAKTDKDGNFCIEVPAGNFRVDLRVWGMERIEGRSYICQGTVQNIDPGRGPKRCGEDCFKTDILTQCEERADQRIGR